MEEQILVYLCKKGKSISILLLNPQRNVSDRKRKNIIAPLFYPTGTSKTKMLSETVVIRQVKDHLL